jgi:hypothetical protein
MFRALDSRPSDRRPSAPLAKPGGHGWRVPSSVKMAMSWAMAGGKRLAVVRDLKQNRILPCWL